MDIYTWINKLSTFINILVLIIAMQKIKTIRYGHDNPFKNLLRFERERRRYSTSSDNIAQRILGIIERLLEARLQRFWTQDDAAEHAKISLTTYKDTEGGKRIPRLSTIRNLCRAFHMSAEDLGLAHYLEPKYRLKRKRTSSREGDGQSIA